MEAAVLAVRRENPVWGGRKIAASLRRQGLSPPSASTITEILQAQRPADGGAGQKAWKRFEHAEPNALWQMDFKGDVAFGQGRLHPLTVVDDHSRYAVVLQATDNERHQTVQNAVQAAFERYGLPEIILTDNGSPWGRHRRADADQVRRLADRAWRGALAQPALAPAEPRQERALQPHPQRRAARAANLRRSPPGPAGLR